MARLALVTGGQRGIWAAISEGLLAAGRKVVASYAGNDAAAAAFTERTGIPCIKFDVADFDACTAAVKRIEKEHGPVEVLVNNAGITRDAMMRKLTRQMWDDVIDTNLGSCYNMCKAVWDGMSARKFGRIVNIGSVNGQAGQLGQVNYAAAAKGGVEALVRALAMEWAPAITVNAIAPGYTRKDSGAHAALTPEQWQATIARIPMARLGTPEDVAHAVAWLASPGGMAARRGPRPGGQLRRC